MSFYLKPPKGETNLHILFECVQQRLKCFQNFQSNQSPTKADELEVNFEYLMEDSILDRTSHFIFRLGVLTGSISKKLFLDNELKLLKQRLECYNKEDMEHFLKKIIRQLKDCIRANIDKQLSEFYWTLYNVVCKMLDKGYLPHIYKNHKENMDCYCDNGYCILVPFCYCNQLLAMRTVNLRNGNAYFDCSEWKKILPALYTSYLRIVLNEMKYSVNVAQVLLDDRVSGCLTLLKNHYSRTDCNTPKTIVRLKDIEAESLYFPLCTKNLYDSLRKNHRLAHNSRFELSIFLKKIGLSLNDSIKFWQGEYSKQHSLCSKCTHSWKDNEKKYLYGIRHLYGLEGSRRNYGVRSCHYMQGTSLGINSEGGCPFVHYDDDNLRSVLKKNLPGLEDDIEVIIFERTENPSVSCKMYSECILKQLKIDSLTKSFENPLQYYNDLKSKKPELT